MTIELKVNLTNEEKDILSKARDLTNDLGDMIRDATDNITGLDNRVTSEMYTRANLCDEAWTKLSDLCDEFGIY